MNCGCQGFGSIFWRSHATWDVHCAREGIELQLHTSFGGSSRVSVAPRCSITAELELSRGQLQHGFLLCASAFGSPRARPRTRSPRWVRGSRARVAGGLDPGAAPASRTAWSGSRRRPASARPLRPRRAHAVSMMTGVSILRFRSSCRRRSRYICGSIRSQEQQISRRRATRALEATLAVNSELSTLCQSSRVSRSVVVRGGRCPVRPLSGKECVPRLTGASPRPPPLKLRRGSPKRLRREGGRTLLALLARASSDRAQGAPSFVEGRGP